MHRALIAALLLGCTHRLGSPRVIMGEPEPLPVVHPSNDDRRWYIPLESEALGPHLLFLDTGYSHTTCDDDLIAALGLKTRGGSKVRGELGVLRVDKARLPPLVLGGHRVEGLVCQVRDLDSTSSIRDPREVPIAGVLGMDVLRRFRVTVDPERNLVRLDPPDAAEHTPREGADVVGLRRERFGTRMRLPLKVAGTVTWPILDTGASETYLDAERMGLVADWEQPGVRFRGTGGTGSTVQTLRYFQADVGVGAHDVGVVTVTGRRRRRCVPGLVGLDVLGRFHQVYDFPGRQAWLTPVGASQPPTWHRWYIQAPPRLEGARLVDGPEVPGGD